MTYNGTCLKCETEFTRETDADPLGNPMVGNIQSTLCPDCEAEFREWLEESGYVANDCWESHIDEYFAEVF